MPFNPFCKEYESDQNDLELINKAITGDKKALEELLKKHQPFVYNIAWKMVQNPTDAEDLTQEVLIKVITNLSQFRGNSKFRTWLYRIVVNHFLQMEKKNREKVVNEDFDGFAQRLASIPDFDLDEFELKEKEKEIKEMNLGCMSAMLLCFTREQRVVYILGELFNADHSLGAEILGISKGNFRVRLSRARKDLLQFMNNKCGLINKANPCRCHKKVTAVIKAKTIDSKNLLFNRAEYTNFQNYISKDADEMLTLVEEKYRELHERFPFKKNFDKKTFLSDLLKDEQLTRLMNLN